MNYNGDGFNERNLYIHNSNNKNTMNKTFDNSFAKMRVEEHRNDITTTNKTQNDYVYEVKGKKDNFVLRNNNIMRANSIYNTNNPIINALNKNMKRR